VPYKRKRGPAKDRKISDVLDGLNRRQRMYVNGIAARKAKKRAAILAGYSASTANNAAAISERLAVREAFQELIQKTIPVPVQITAVRCPVPRMSVDVSTVEQQIIDDSLQRVATVPPDLAMVMAKGSKPGKKGGHEGR
jgi:phage terminase small subunit